MITINLGSFPEGTDIGKVISDLVSPLTAKRDDHTHDYMIVLADAETGNGYELNRFQAPCAVEDSRANLATTIGALRDAADQLADAHADILEPDPAIPTSTLLDLLSLVQAQVTEDMVDGWTDEMRRRAELWAGAVHMAASDNDIEVPEQPPFIVVGDFPVGTVVRNRHTGARMTVTPGGVWLESFYEEVED